MTATVDKKSGLVSFLDAKGQALLAQSAWTFSPAADPSRDGLNVGASFHRAPGEHFYGGGVINDLRQPSDHVSLANNNTQIRIPILYSNRGYSFFWDNTSRGDLNLSPSRVSWHGSAGDLADYYVMAGPSADQAIAEYRNLTGAAPLFPKWAYGFWFSKNKFDNQKQILDAAKKFREEQIPIDALRAGLLLLETEQRPDQLRGLGLASLCGGTLSRCAGDDRHAPPQGSHPFHGRDLGQVRPGD